MVSQRRRVAIFLWWFQVGGTERHALRLLRHIDRDRFEVDVICYKAAGDLAGDFAALGLPTHVLRSWGRWGLPLTVPRLARLCARRQYDVVHCLLGYTLLLGPVAARLARVPRVVTSERNQFDWKLSGPKAMAAGWVNRHLVDHIVVNSGAIGKVLTARERLDAAKIVVIPNGLETGGFPADVAETGTWRASCRDRLAAQLDSPPDGGPWIGMAASFQELKGHAVVLRAFAASRSELPRARLLMAGDGALRTSLHAEAARLGIAERVHWLGRRTDVPALLGACDLLVVASTMEGFPNVVVEALAAGTPVLSTELPYLHDLGDLRAHVRDFPVGDSPSLARLLVEAWRDSAWRAQAACEAPTLARQRHGLQAEVRAHEALYCK